MFRTFTKNSEKTQSSRKMPKVHALPITASSMEKVRDTSKFLRNDDDERRFDRHKHIEKSRHRKRKSEDIEQKRKWDLRIEI